MKVVKIIIGKTDGTIERNILRVPERANISNAICAYGTARQQAYGDVAGITHKRGYVWRGYDGNASGCPALADWVEMPRESKDCETWDTLIAKAEGKE